MIRLENPIIDNEALARLKDIELEGFQSRTLGIRFNFEPRTGGLVEGKPTTKPKPGDKVSGKGLEEDLQLLFEEADQAIKDGVNILILSDRNINSKLAPMPALLAVAGLHHHLIRQGTRTRVSIVLESAGTTRGTSLRGPSRLRSRCG